MKKFNGALTAIYGPKISGATLPSADGSFFYFNRVLNRPSIIIEDAIVRLPQISTVMETRKAVQQLSYGKAPGADAIPVEVYKIWGYP